MDKDEWIARAAKRIVDVASWDRQDAWDYAVKLYRTCVEEDDPNADPEESADMDMSYWDDDEATP